MKDKTYFLTCTIQNWYYIFDRHNRFEILKNSIEYCQKHFSVEAIFLSCSSCLKTGNVENNTQILYFSLNLQAKQKRGIAPLNVYTKQKETTLERPAIVKSQIFSDK